MKKEVKRDVLRILLLDVSSGFKNGYFCCLHGYNFLTDKEYELIFSANDEKKLVKQIENLPEE